MASSENVDASSTTGPLTETVESVSSYIWGIVSSNTPNDLQPRVLIITLTLAVIIFLLRKGHGSKGADGKERKVGLLQFLFPKDIYTHVSARVDIGLWVVERILHPFWSVALLATVGPFVEQTMIASLQSIFGNTPALEINYAWMVLYSLVILLSYDFIFFTIHYSMHKIPALWVIHKIHHSAEVLTPITRTREHFIAGPIWATGSAISFGFSAGLFAYLFDGGITQATILNVGFFAFLFGFNGAFRHYHVQFHYPKWLSYWLQSPAMHHTHHSYLRKHWDTNMAAVTSIWDRMFGTLYIPEKDEYTPWGIGPNSQHEYRTLWQNLVGPFKDWYGMIVPKKVIDSRVDSRIDS